MQSVRNCVIGLPARIVLRDLQFSRTQDCVWLHQLPLPRLFPCILRRLGELCNPEQGPGKYCTSTPKLQHLQDTGAHAPFLGSVYGDRMTNMRQPAERSGFGGGGGRAVPAGSKHSAWCT